MDETCPHGFVTVRHCLECLATALDREAADLERIVQERRRRCPDCGGTALSPYPQDGGSCPHCVGGFLP